MQDKETRALYDETHKPHGHLSRQTGEPMFSDLQRWDKAYALLKELADTYDMSKELRGDMLLERAGLAEVQQMLILTSTVQSTNIDE